MNKEYLETLVSQNLSIRKISDVSGVPYSSVRYWLKIYNLSTNLPRWNRGNLFYKDTRYKCRCGETDPTKFYGRKVSICSKCHNSYTLELGKKKREYAIDLLGGKCLLCGYNSYYGAIDIHHLDPSKKMKNLMD